MIIPNKVAHTYQKMLQAEQSYRDACLNYAPKAPVKVEQRITIQGKVMEPQQCKVLSIKYDPYHKGPTYKGFRIFVKGAKFKNFHLSEGHKIILP